MLIEPGRRLLAAGSYMSHVACAARKPPSQHVCMSGLGWEHTLHTCTKSEGRGNTPADLRRQPGLHAQLPPCGRRLARVQQSPAHCITDNHESMSESHEQAYSLALTHGTSLNPIPPSQPAKLVPRARWDPIPHASAHIPATQLKFRSHTCHVRTSDLNSQTQPLIAPASSVPQPNDYAGCRNYRITNFVRKKL